MNSRKTGRIIGTFALAVGLALTASACGGGDKPTDPKADTSTTAPAEDAANPKDVVVAGIEHLNTSPVTVNVTMGKGMSMEMDMDIAAGKATGTVTMDAAQMDPSMTGEVVIEMIMNGDDIWMKYSGDDPTISAMGDTWMHTSAGTGSDSDITGTADSIIEGLGEVTETGPNTYKITMAEGADNGFGLGGLGGLTGSKDTDPSQEATITLDDEGRFVKMEGADGEGNPIVMEVTAYDVTVEAEKPSGEITEI